MTLAVLVAGATTACTEDEPPARNLPAPGGELHAASPTGGREAQPSFKSSPESEPGDAQGRVRVRDRASRRTARGDVPAYVEIEEASVNGDAGALGFTVRLAGDVPARTPRGAGLRVSFQVLKQSGDRMNLEAQASETGWSATATAGEQGVLPVTLKLGTDTVEIEVDRSDIGVGPFQWLASVAWTKGSSYGFDSAPETGYARFPG